MDDILTKVDNQSEKRLHGNEDSMEKNSTKFGTGGNDDLEKHNQTKHQALKKG